MASIRVKQLVPNTATDGEMKKINFWWQLIVYDILILLVVDLLLLVFYRSNEALSLNGIALHASIGCVCVFLARILSGTCRQIWRYGGIQCHNRLLAVLQKDILVPNDVKEEWVQTYEKETGEDISFF